MALLKSVNDITTKQTMKTRNSDTKVVPCQLGVLGGDQNWKSERRSPAIESPVIESAELSAIAYSTIFSVLIVL